MKMNLQPSEEKAQSGGRNEAFSDWPCAEMGHARLGAQEREETTPMWAFLTLNFYECRRNASSMPGGGHFRQTLIEF
jgi:hypothetical protein